MKALVLAAKMRPAPPVDRVLPSLLEFLGDAVFVGHNVRFDRSFLDGVPGDSRGAGFITAMLALAEHLGLTVVAEGIETEEQLAFLRAEQCEYGQGYHLARPMPAAQVTELLRALAAR